MTTLRSAIFSLVLMVPATSCSGTGDGPDTRSGEAATGGPTHPSELENGSATHDDQRSEDTPQSNRPRSLDFDAADDHALHLPQRRSDDQFDFPGIQSEVLDEHHEEERCELEVTATNEAIQFAHDSNKITPEGRRALQAVAEAISGTEEVRVVGHTSTEGDTAYNQELSEGRAAAVANVLEELMDPTPTLDSSGRGELEPLVTPDDTEEQRERNRRVVITSEVEQEQCEP